MADAIKFNTLVKHGRLIFAPAVAYAFEDPDAAPYFKSAGWAEDTGDEPVMTFPLSAIDIDPETKFGGGDKRGKLVMGSSD